MQPVRTFAGKQDGALNFELTRWRFYYYERSPARDPSNLKDHEANILVCSLSSSLYLVRTCISLFYPCELYPCELEVRKGSSSNLSQGFSRSRLRVFKEVWPRNGEDEIDDNTTGIPSGTIVISGLPASLWCNSPACACWTVQIIELVCKSIATHDPCLVHR